MDGNVFELKLLSIMNEGESEKLGGFSVRQFLWRTPPLLRAKNTNADHIDKLPEIMKDRYPCDTEVRLGLADGGPVVFLLLFLKTC